MKYDLVVAGGGLSGVAAAVSAAQDVSAEQFPTILFIPLCHTGQRWIMIKSIFHRVF